MALVLILVAGAVAIYFIDQLMKVNEIQKRQDNLQTMHDRTIAHIETSMDKFATFASSIKAYLDYSAELPKPKAFQRYVNTQLQMIDSYDSMVISYIDTAYVLQYCFNRTKLNSCGIEGTSIKNIRNQEQLAEMRRTMENEHLQFYRPFNLIEGWVGIPIDFGLIKNEKTIGFIACTINFNDIITAIYKTEGVEEFVYHFSTIDGIDFNRQAIFDGSTIYNKDTDNEYYKNFNVPKEEFIYSTITAFGLDLRVGTAYKQRYERNIYFTLLIYCWYALLMVFSLVMVRRVYFYRQKNIESRSANELLREGNKLLYEKSQKIKSQNTHLNELMNTKNKFFAIISHDVKSPLNSILSLLQLLKERKFEDKSIEQIVELLHKSTYSTMKLLENLLSWAKLQTGDLKYEPAAFDMKELASEVETVFKGNTEQKKIWLNNQIQKSLLVYGDHNMIYTVLRNAVSNAIKFTNPGGQIKIYSIDDTDGVTIAVADNGVGMTQAEVQELFKVDSKFKKEGTAGEKGTGLGLILCKEFIARHNGNVCIESEADRGTTFYFTLPRKDVFYPTNATSDGNDKSTNSIHTTV